MKTRNKNLLISILGRMHVKFTNAYADKLYNETSHNDTLYGISKMLVDYNIKKTAIKMNDKDELNSIKSPFLANLNGNVILIYKLTDKKVHYIKDTKKSIIPIEEFKNLWDRVVLLLEKTQYTIEPGYKENCKTQVFRFFQNKGLIFCCIIMLLVNFIVNSIYSNPALLSLLISNAIGVYIGYLLLQKQMYIPNTNADKICSLLKKGGCNDVLESPAAKFLGLIGWGQIGFSYFISNILIIILFPQLIPYLVLVNICALPYSFWSVWYQRFKVKQWCPLCLIVQILLWVVFVINQIFYPVFFPQFTLVEILSIALVYLIPFFIIDIFYSKFTGEKQLERILNEMNELRLKPQIFETLLKQQPHHDINLSTSQIIWGDKKTNMLVSVVTNPHCPPCAEMHKRIEKLLKKSDNKICVQYIFSSYNEDFEISSKFLASVYLSEQEENTKKIIFSEWFEKGKYNRESFFDKYKYNINNPSVESEIHKHNEWRQEVGIHATPTILINGYELPENYKIEDLVYFTKLEI